MSVMKNERQVHHISRIELHSKEERIKRIFRDQIAEAAGLIEVVVSIIVLIGVLGGAIPVIADMLGLFVQDPGVTFDIFLKNAFSLVIGVEFIKMLAKHSPGSALEVILYAIARHMVIGHSTALDTLFSVLAIAAIFAIRKFLFVPSFGATMPGGEPAPDVPVHPKDEPDETFT